MGFVDVKDGLGRQASEMIDAFRKEMPVSFTGYSKDTETRILELI